MSELHDDVSAGDELDGPPIEIRKGRRARFKFAMAPQWVMLMTDLPTAAFKLYCILLAHANQVRGDGRAWPMEETLARMMGYSRRQTITPLVQALKDRDLVDVKPDRYGQNNSRRRNIYTVHEVPPGGEGWDGIASIEEWYAAQKEAAAEAAAKAVQGTDAKRNGGDAGAEGDAAGSPTRPTSTSAEPRRGNPSGDGGRRARGAAASRRAPGKRMTKPEAAAVRTVEAAWPAALAQALPQYRPPVLREEILGALEGRTVEQLVARVQRRWVDHGWERKHADGEIESYVAVAVALVRPPRDCPDASCEDGTLIDTGEPCRACETRRQDRRRERRRGVVPEQRGGAAPARERPECAGPECSTVWGGEGDPPEGWMCRPCQENQERAEHDEREAAAAAARLREQFARDEAVLEEARGLEEEKAARAAAEEARVRGVLAARGMHGERLTWAVRQHMAGWSPDASAAVDVDELVEAAADQGPPPF